MTIKILTVGGTLTVRKTINEMVKSISRVKLVDTAQNNLFAIPKIKQLKPDVILLIIEKKGLNIKAILSELRAVCSTPIIILSPPAMQEQAKRGLYAGAQEFVPLLNENIESQTYCKFLLESAIKALVHKKAKKLLKTEQQTASTPPEQIDALVIGSSTGGPKVLTKIISYLPQKIGIPIFIVQHMPEGFTTSLAERLNALGSNPVVEAEDQMKVEEGKVYLAPGGKHMVIRKNRIHLLETEKIHAVRPAVDPLFESAVKRYGKNLLAILLTGMGKDGTAGCLAVKKAGGYVLAQNEASSVIFGMPKHAHEAGVVDKLLSVEEIIQTINEMVKV